MSPACSMQPVSPAVKWGYRNTIPSPGVVARASTSQNGKKSAMMIEESDEKNLNFICKLFFIETLSWGNVQINFLLTSADFILISLIALFTFHRLGIYTKAFVKIPKT